MTTDTTALQERIARVLHEIDPISGHGHDWRKLSDAERKFYIHKADAVLPIIAAEVQAAKAEALREAADGIDLGEIAEEWSQGPGNRDDMHWAAGNAASGVVITLHDRATEYKTGERA